MAEVGAGELVVAAGRDGHGVAAFNVITLEHGEAVVTAAEQADRPVILQVSENAVKYHDGWLTPLTQALRALATAADVPVALHLDHVEDAGLLERAPAAGYRSVMVDAGSLPYDENVAETARRAEYLHAHGVFVEAELGYVGGKATQVTSAHAPGVRTDPAQAAEYVRATGVDALAVAVGSSHAMTERTADLDHALISGIRDAVDVPLVLHGSSGVPDESLRAAIRAGIVKVNIGTALNVAFTAAVRSSLAGYDGVDPRTYLRAARTEMTGTARALIDLVTAP
ncbi:ketose-bisphosphate aldolase [Spongisporangium articulatum]|uniref:Ketose-bisphosphate aldolase n=1 Tax=Spongisporangium articulatum TaxID=3362603 RepID=A0ABW8AGQ7_9ACTN